jgi:hypothetical protein
LLEIALLRTASVKPDASETWEFGRALRSRAFVGGTDPLVPLAQRLRLPGFIIEQTRMYILMSSKNGAVQQVINARAPPTERNSARLQLACTGPTLAASGSPLINGDLGFWHPARKRHKCLYRNNLACDLGFEPSREALRRCWSDVVNALLYRGLNRPVWAQVLSSALCHEPAMRVASFVITPAVRCWRRQRARPGSRPVYWGPSGRSWPKPCHRARTEGPRPGRCGLPASINPRPLERPRV